MHVKPQVPMYRWVCHACREVNSPGLMACAKCGCPVSVSATEVTESLRRGFFPPPQSNSWLNERTRRVTAFLIVVVWSVTVVRFTLVSSAALDTGVLHPLISAFGAYWIVAYMLDWTMWARATWSPPLSEDGSADNIAARAIGLIFGLTIFVGDIIWMIGA